MNKIYRWILVAITLGVLSACANMGAPDAGVYEGTAIEPVSIPPSVGD